MIRLIVRGPFKYETDFVKVKLNELTDNLKDCVLVSDMRPGREYNRSPSHFPQAEVWHQGRWLTNVRQGNDPKRFSTIVRHHAPYSGFKQQVQGQKARRLSMVRDATALVAFWDVGGKDEETESMIQLAKAYDLKLKVIRL